MRNTVSCMLLSLFISCKTTGLYEEIRRSVDGYNAKNNDKQIVFNRDFNPSKEIFFKNK